MKKKLFVGVICLLMLFTFTGCGSKKGDVNTKNGKGEVKEKIKGNCTVFECIKTIEPTDTLEQVNEKMGFDGSLDKDEESYKIYKWEVTKDTSVEVNFPNSGKSTIKINFDEKAIANDKLDLSQFDEMKSIINKGEMTLEKFNEMVGNVEGTLIEKSAYSVKYEWYKSSSDYLKGSFSTTSNKCTFVSGLRSQQ